jgi:hypothetical protein
MTTQYILKNNDGTFYYKDREMRVLHREDGPAAEWANGSKYWYLNGTYHRVDGSAVEDIYSASKHWYLHGKLHREDGPAIERANGDKYWYLHGKLHREDGPAVEYVYGSKLWYLNGNLYGEEEHKKLTKKEPTISIEGKSFTVAQLKALIEKATI